MSDARSKLTEALAKAETKRASDGPKPPSTSAPKPAPAKPSPSKPKKIQPPKKKKVPKPKKTGPNASSAMFKSLSKFANNMLDELKTATTEISPSALIHTATDSFQSIKKAVGFENASIQDPNQTPNTTQKKQTAPDTPASEPTQASKPERAKSQLASADSPDAPSTPQAAPTPPGAQTSPAKVKRMPSKKKKTTQESSASSQEEPTQEELLAQLNTETPPEPTLPHDTAATITPSSATTGNGQSAGEKPEQDETGSSAPIQEDLPDSQASEPEPQITQEASEAPSVSEETTLTPESGASPNHSNPSQIASKPKIKPAPKPQNTAISKTEHAVRSFQALHNLLNNPLWEPIATNLETKPGPLYAPRENFDTNFPDPIFRAGLKSASRLASTFGFEPEKIRFNPKIIDQIKNIDIDPEGKIKPHTENISSAIGEEKVKEIMGLYHNKNVKLLLFSVSTRLGSFVPTIESLARIYLSLRKKEPLTPSERLQIQEEILMRYKKAPYTEAMGKKARNLALNYFMDYLLRSALKLYKERFKDAPDGQNTPESQQRRHATIKTFCCDMIADSAQKVAISTPAIKSVQAKFTEKADQHLETLLEGVSNGSEA